MNLIKQAIEFISKKDGSLLAIKPVSSHPDDFQLFRVLWIKPDGQCVIHLFNAEKPIQGLSGGKYISSYREALEAFNNV